MQKLLTQTGLICLLLFSSFDANSQFNKNTNPFWQGEIQMHDGTVKSGFVQPPNIAAQKKLAFKPSKKGAVEEIKREKVSSIKVVSVNGTSFYYDNLPIGSVKKDKISKKSYFLLVQARNDFVTFYIMSTYKVNKRTGNIDFMAKYIQGKDIPTYSHYMSKGDKTDAKMYYMTKQVGGIKKNADLHFAEDPELVKRIENKELKGKDVSEIIQAFLATTKNM